MGYAKRTDANHTEMIYTLRRLGWHVEDTSRLPNFVDLVAARCGRIALCEIKSRTGKRTKSQERLIADFAEAGVTVKTLRTIADCEAL